MIRWNAPWTDRAGRLAPLKAAVFAGLFLPALWIAFEAATGMLFPKPVTEAIHRSGDWAIRFLLLSLLVTPLMRSTRSPKLIAVRRMIGVAAFAYATLHLTLYALDQSFNLVRVATEIALRFYLTIGFAVFLGLAALAATSTDAMIARLGARWSRLHKLVYALAALALLHFAIQAKADVSEPAMMTGFFVVLMLFRVGLKRRAPAWIAALAAVGVAIPATALIEAAWYALVRHIDFWQVLAANFDPEMAFRPSAYVAAAGLAFAALAFFKRAPAAQRPSTVLAAAE